MNTIIIMIMKTITVAQCNFSSHNTSASTYHMDHITVFAVVIIVCNIMNMTMITKEDSPISDHKFTIKNTG